MRGTGDQPVDQAATFGHATIWERNIADSGELRGVAVVVDGLPDEGAHGVRLKWTAASVKRWIINSPLLQPEALSPSGKSAPEP